MANGQVFKKNDAGIRNLLKSAECLKLMERYASDRAKGEYIRPFIGFDRAKCFIYEEEAKK